MNKPAEQLIANLLTWTAIFGVTFLFKGAAEAKDANETVSRFLDVSQFGYIVVGCLVVFTMFSLIAEKSKKLTEQANARHFGNLSLDELGSNLFRWIHFPTAPRLASGKKWGQTRLISVAAGM